MNEFCGVSSGSHRNRLKKKKNNDITVNDKVKGDISIGKRVAFCRNN